jgi:hypothetical protein
MVNFLYCPAIFEAMVDLAGLPGGGELGELGEKIPPRFFNRDGTFWILGNKKPAEAGGVGCLAQPRILFHRLSKYSL